MHYNLVEDVVDRLEEEPKDWLLLSPHPDFPGQWLVESFDSGWIFDFRDLRYRAVSPAGLEAFLSRCEELGYRVAFFEPPEAILEPWERLDEVPEFSLNSSFPNTVAGMLPFQLKGYNFLKDLRGGIAQMSTGTGKTVLATALLKHHLLKRSFDTALTAACSS